MSDELWIACGSKLTGKLALRVYLTGVMPGLETLVHFAETAADCYANNNVGAEVNLLSRAPNVAGKGVRKAHSLEKFNIYSDV